MNKNNDINISYSGGKAIIYPTEFNCMIQNINIPSEIFLKREELDELGRRGPYHRYINFPISGCEITDIKFYSGVKND